MKYTIAKMKSLLGWSNSKIKLQKKELGNLKVDLEDRLHNRNYVIQITEKKDKKWTQCKRNTGHY